jgi:hypothetical protein
VPVHVLLKIALSIENAASEIDISRAIFSAVLSW